MPWYLLMSLLLVVLHGCAKNPQTLSPAPIATQQPVVEPVTQAPVTQPPNQVVILVSENIPAYTNVAKTLTQLVGQRVSTIYLSDNQVDNIKTIKQISESDNIQIVSIGLNAAIKTKSLTHKQVIFCQVYNYQDYDLISPLHKGVSMIPSLSQTFKTWRELSPKIKNIGIISGPGFNDVIKAAKVSAHTYGITLHHETVNSDKEYQYAYKKMGTQVQGYWLLPDNRVLSEITLRNIMSFSVRNGKQVAVFNDELLNIGGLLKIQNDENDIAQQVYARLKQSRESGNISGPDITNLSKLKIQINPVMAKNLGITIPKKYRKFAHGL